MLCLLSIGIVVQAQVQKDSSLVTNSNVEKLIDKYSGKVEAVLVSLAKELKQPIEHVYGILVKQQVINSMVYSVVPIFALLSLFMAYRNGTHKKADFDEGNALAVTSIIFLILGIILSIATAFALVPIFTGFFNPEYGALKDIVSFIK